MTKIWALLLIFASACNVANQPTSTGASGVVAAGDTMTLTNVAFNRNEGSGFATIVLNLSGPQTTATTINYTVSGTATGGAACTAGVDYITPPGSVMVGAGSRSSFVSIVICPDALYEGDENFVFTLTDSSPSLGIGQYASTTVTILDAATPPPISFATSGISIVEGQSGTTVVPVDVQLNYASVNPITVEILAGGSATQGTDYTVSTNSVTFPPGTTVATVLVTVVGDTVVELNENIVLSLFNPLNGVIGYQPRHTIQIQADETPNPMRATLLGVAPQPETGGLVNMVVQIDGSTDHPVTLNFEVDHSSAISQARRATFGAGGDFFFPGFSGTSASITIPAFTSGVRNIPIRINDDVVYEGNEGAIIRLLGGPELAVSGSGIAELVIVDNDTQPLISFLTTAQTVTESNTVRNAVVRLLDPGGSGNEVIVGQDVVVTIGTTNITANAYGRNDYSVSAGTVTIPAGSSRVNLPFSAMVDLIDENDETFDITLAPPLGYSVVGALGTHRVTIVDVDAPPRVNFEFSSQNDVYEHSAGTLSLNVTFDALSERQVILNYSIAGLSVAAGCAAGVDMATTGSLTVPPDSTMPFPMTGISVCNDAFYEGNETAVITLNNATNAQIGGLATHTVTVLDGVEGPPNVSVTAGVTNFDERATSGNFTVTVAATGKPFTLTYSVTGTSGVGVDHTLPATGFINIAASTSPQVIPVTFDIIDDILPENDETIIMTVSAALADATIVTPSATITINSNDPLQLALGYRHTCGLLQGRVKCWGFGQALGKGTTPDYGDNGGELVSALQAIDLGSGFTPIKIVAGRDFTCALSSAGTVKCWGLNDQGQLGQGRPGNTAATQYIGDDLNEMGSALPAVDLGGFIKDIETSANSSHVCALYNSNRMKCWGANTLGQLGASFSGASCSTAIPNTLCQGDHFGEIAALNFLIFPNAAAATVVRMSVGAAHTCAQLSNATVMCWGANTSGALGIDVDPATNSVRYLHGAPYAETVKLNAFFDITKLSRLSSNTDTTCATFDDVLGSDAICWGDGISGALGRGTTTNIGTNTNTLAALASPISTTYSAYTSGVKIGYDFSCVRDNDGTRGINCWGNNSVSQLGAAVATTATPTSGSFFSVYTDVYVGYRTGCSVVGAFQYSCWGQNLNGSAGALTGATVATPSTARDF